LTRESSIAFRMGVRGRASIVCSHLSSTLRRRCASPVVGAQVQRLFTNGSSRIK
jgi:hypothetical protein